MCIISLYKNIYIYITYVTYDAQKVWLGRWVPASLGITVWEEPPRQSQQMEKRAASVHLGRTAVSPALQHWNGFNTNLPTNLKHTKQEK